MAVDLGGTIEDSWKNKRAWFASRGFEFGPWSCSREEIVRHLGGQDALYEQMTADVYSDEHILGHEPIVGAVDALTTIARRFRIVILSSRREQQRPATITWLQRHGLVACVDDVICLGSDTRKLAWCLEAGTSILIDDDVRHLEPTRGPLSVARIHLCTRPRNARQRHRHVRTAGSWHEILGMISRLRRSR